MEYTVSTLSILFMAAAALAGIAIPAVLFLVLRKKYRADILPFFIGCAVFIVFALLIEGFINKFIFSSAFGLTLQSNIWFYNIFGGLMAGLFEETGRYAAFKTVLRTKCGNDRNALMYGAGHGGFEALCILVFSMVTNIVIAAKLNAGMADSLTAGVTDQAALQTLYATFAALSGTAPALFLLSIVERIAAVAIQISCSVLVWFAAKNGGRQFWLYPLALLLHALVDMMAVILAGYISQLWVVLGLVYILAAIYILIARLAWQKNAAEAGIKAKFDTGATI